MYTARTGLFTVKSGLLPWYTRTMNKATKLQVLDLALKLAAARSTLDYEREWGTDTQELNALRAADEEALAALKAALGLK